ASAHSTAPWASCSEWRVDCSSSSWPLRSTIGFSRNRSRGGSRTRNRLLYSRTFVTILYQCRRTSKLGTRDTRNRRKGRASRPPEGPSQIWGLDNDHEQRIYIHSMVAGNIAILLHKP